MALMLAKVALAGLAVLPPVLHAEEITVHHSQGETRVPVNPKVVAVLDIASLDTLSAIGVNVAGVPTTPYPPYLSKFAGSQYRKVGSLFEPDYEALNALSPDLIIVGGRSAPRYAQVAKLAPTIDLSPDLQHRVDSAIAHAEILGQIFGKQAEVASRVSRLKQSIAALRARTATMGTGLLIMTSGGRISAVGPDSWFGTLYNDFGVRPASSNLDASSPHGQVVSSEFLLRTDPDWLFVIDRDVAIGQAGAPAKQLLDNELVRQTRAWTAGHVVYLDPVTWYIVGDGLTALQRMVDEVSRAVSASK
ncbi:siderophore ABC transporter substrate-binding protein [Paraburkholderia sp. USG1]|uniref:siderophore ABC transporter substrate-binding protein n=1 Tax=Paraburkholderia sp. USG1 TaxID=2952268 RepID=UPI00285CDA24|nr:siderophore ABC transporter substrate-binding protein [Paraburkholderia sp. USG1]MDR8398344.1 siderophore ABC transporter substrate-binding protein [Paraburkholderia sp. USG1]